MSGQEPEQEASARQLLDAIAVADRAAVASLVADRPALVDHRVDGLTPLHVAVFAVTSNNAIPAQDGGPVAHGIVDDLLAAGADVEARAPDGHTPLHAAAFCGNDELITRLLGAGADPAATVGDVIGSTPLSFALFYANSSAAGLLADAGRHPDDLRSAAGLDDVAGLDRWLPNTGSLEPGADAGMAFTAPIAAFPPRVGPITDQLTIDESLTWASRNGALAAMDRLVARGADVNANPYRGTALLWSIYSEQVEAANWLIDNGADVDLAHDFGGAEHGHLATALHLAAQFGSLPSIEVLLDAGADRTIRDGSFSGTPQEWAEHSDQPAAAERLSRA